MPISVPHLPTSLSSRILMQMALRVAIVIVMASVTGSYFVYRSVEKNTLENLSKYVRERGERESMQFLNVQSNLRVILDAYLDDIARPAPANTGQEFKRLFVQNPDGAWRRRPESHDIQTQPASMLSARTPLTMDSMRRVLSTDRLTTAYGRAWKNQMATVYLASMDGLYSTYWPGIDWAKETKADQKFSELPWVINADQQHNPTRSHAWTGIWFDWVARNWYATCILPADVDGEFRHYAGGAIALDDILKRTASVRIAGTHNMILRHDGLVIAHPLYDEKIKQSEGVYNLNNSGDAHLQAQFQAVIHGGETGVKELTQYDEYLGVARIEGPGWYFVTTFPKKIIAETARKAAEVFLYLGVISLALELLILWLIIRRQIALPLHQLSAKAALIRQGDMSTRCDITGNDELSDLAKSFNSMVDAVQANSDALKKNNLALESRVAERTNALNKQNELLIAEIADRTRAEAELKNSLSLQQATLESTHDGILAVDLNNNWLLYNQPFVDLWLITDEILAAKDDRIALSYVLDQLEDADGFLNKVKELYATPEARSFDVIHLKNGKVIERYSIPQRIDGKVVGRVWTFHDATERKRAEELVYRLAYYDVVTKLANRLLLGERLTQAMLAGKRSGHHGAVMFMDLDEFKSVNDLYGHVAGDMLLIEVAQRIKKCIREADTAARFGGDEFVVLAQGLSSERSEARAQAVQLAEKIRRSLAEPYVLNLAADSISLARKIECRCSASIGIEVFLGSESPEDEIIKRADMAMYQAKSLGRNLIRCYGAAF